MNKKKSGLFTDIHAVICLIEAHYDDGEIYRGVDSYLYGPKQKGFGRGFMMPPGGKYEIEDHGNAILTAQRECLQETGLHVFGGEIVGKMVVTINDKNQRLHIKIVKFSRWVGEKVTPNNEFKWLDFLPLPALLNENLLPCDADWLQRVLIEKKPTEVHMICGENRANVLHYFMDDLR